MWVSTVAIFSKLVRRVSVISLFLLLSFSVSVILFGCVLCCSLVCEGLDYFISVKTRSQEDVQPSGDYSLSDYCFPVDGTLFVAPLERNTDENGFNTRQTSDDV